MMGEILLLSDYEGDHEVSMANTLTTTVESRILPIFFRLLQNGFVVEAEEGRTVKAFLEEYLGLEKAYIDKRIQTIFLDGDAVDDVETAVVRDGSVLALSAAMPGLAGAVLRRGSSYAPMRREISHTKTSGQATARKGKVVVKLFNLLIRELGPLVLERGIVVDKTGLNDLLEKHSSDFVNGVKTIEFNGEECGLDRLAGLEWDSGQVLLRVTGA
jgi:hypothetical protein